MTNIAPVVSTLHSNPSTWLHGIPELTLVPLLLTALSTKSTYTSFWARIFAVTQAKSSLCIFALSLFSVFVNPSPDFTVFPLSLQIPCLYCNLSAPINFPRCSGPLHLPLPWITKTPMVSLNLNCICWIYVSSLRAGNIYSYPHSFWYSKAGWQVHSNHCTCVVTLFP